MGQTADEITAHIDHSRAELGSNLQELEQKVKHVTDWRQHFRDNPMTMVGAAFGGGILLAGMTRKRRHSRARSWREDRDRGEPQPHAATDRQKHKAMETWDHIKGALIGVAATQFKQFVGEVVPGFSDHYRQAEEKARAAQPEPR